MSAASSRRAEHHQERFRYSRRFERRRRPAGQRQVDDREAEQPHRDRGERAGDEHDQQQRREHPGEEVEADHRPAPVGDHRHPGAARFDRRRVDRALGADRAARHRGGDREAEVFEDRRRDVGRGDVAVGAGRVGGEVAVEAAARRSRSGSVRRSSRSGVAIAITRPRARRHRARVARPRRARRRSRSSPARLAAAARSTPGSHAAEAGRRSAPAGETPRPRAARASRPAGRFDFVRGRFRPLPPPAANQASGSPRRHGIGGSSLRRRAS